MMQTTWLVLAVFSFAALGLAFLSEEPDRTIMGGLVAFIGWGLWSFAAFNVQIPDQGGGQPIQLSYPPLAIFGVLLAVIALALTIEAVLYLLNPEESTDLVRDWGRDESGRRY